MKQTLVEKIFSGKLGRPVAANETCFCPVDIVMGTDATTPLAIEIFNELNQESVKYPEKIVLVNDHFIPAKDIATAKLALLMQRFARQQNIRNFFSVGRSGICHVLLPEQGLVRPYDIIVGADSHTCTYGALGAFSTGIGSTDMACAWATGKLWFKIPETIKVIFKGILPDNVYAKDLILYLIGRMGINGAVYDMIEFEGEVIERLDMSGRLTICNMSIEMGAKSAIVNVDDVTRHFFRDLNMGIEIDDSYLSPDPDAPYKDIISIDVTDLEPVIACPFSPDNIRFVKELKGLKIDQVVIGSCTNGRIEDFRLAHRHLKDHKVHPDVKLIIIPGSQKVMKQLIEEKMLIDFIDSGAVISPPTCGPCMGGHMGVLADHEVGLYTTNRNFLGRNGDSTAEVYLCNPAVAAYSAVQGSLQLPQKDF
jgi:3-isopropylmalate/(R)-2-methylmalate dehydratase large subunit